MVATFLTLTLSVGQGARDQRYRRVARLLSTTQRGLGDIVLPDTSSQQKSFLLSCAEAQCDTKSGMCPREGLEIGLREVRGKASARRLLGRRCRSGLCANRKSGSGARCLAGVACRWRRQVK